MSNGIPCERCSEHPAVTDCWLCVECQPIDRYDFEAVAVMAGYYSAYDLADHMADVMPEVIDGRSLWDMDAMELAVLASLRYPGGACSLQLALMGVG